MGKQVLITGCYGTGNFGDEKVLQSLIRLTRKQYDKCNITVASSDPEYTKKHNSVQYSFRNIEHNVANYIKKLRDVDILLIGGGTIIAAPFSYRHSILALLGRYFCDKVYIISAGVGYIEEGLDRKVITELLSQVDCITVRDEDTKNVLLTEYTHEPIDVVPDIGFLKDPNITDYSDNLPENCILVCGRKSDYSDIKGFAESFDMICEQGDYKILFLPLKYPGDVTWSNRVVDKMDNDAVFFNGDLDELEINNINEDIIVYENELRVRKIESIIASALIVIGVRLHSIIVAAAHETPLVPISYHPKSRSVLRQLGVNDWFVHRDIDSQQLSKEIVNKTYKKYGIDSATLEKLKLRSESLFKIVKQQDRSKSNPLLLPPILFITIIKLKLHSIRVRIFGNTEQTRFEYLKSDRHD